MNYVRYQTTTLWWSDTMPIVCIWWNSSENSFASVREQKKFSMSQCQSIVSVSVLTDYMNYVRYQTTTLWWPDTMPIVCIWWNSSENSFASVREQRKFSMSQCQSIVNRLSVSSQ